MLQFFIPIMKDKDFIIEKAENAIAQLQTDKVIDDDHYNMYKFAHEANLWTVVAENAVAYFPEVRFFENFEWVLYASDLLYTVIINNITASEDNQIPLWLNEVELQKSCKALGYKTLQPWSKVVNVNIYQGGKLIASLEELKEFISTTKNLTVDKSRLSDLYSFFTTHPNGIIWVD